MAARRTWTDDELVDAVRGSYSLLGTLRGLGLKPGGGQYVQIRAHIARLGISTAHWQGKAWRRGSTAPVTPARSLDELLVEGTHLNTVRLKARLVREGLLHHRCDECGIVEWRGERAPLQLDHVNGDRTDNRLSNLRLLCPNCHAQTSTYCGKNIGRTA